MEMRLESSSGGEKIYQFEEVISLKLLGL